MNERSELEATLDTLGLADGVLNPVQPRTVAPRSAEEVAAILGSAASVGVPVGFVGSGSVLRPFGIAYPLVLSSSALGGVIDWQVDDLTVTVGPGLTVGELESMLAERNQTSLLPDADTHRTVGGIVAAGSSGLGRLRYGPTRDRVLEATLATGYGHVVRGGGRLVKNVTGYDLPRLATGSLGSLGFLTSVCLKLWPRPQARAVVAVENASNAYATLYRPTAVIETESGHFAVIEGSEADVENQRRSIDGSTVDPQVVAAAIESPVVVSVRVPSRHVQTAIELVADTGAVRWNAAHGVGTVDAGWETLTAEGLKTLRDATTRLGGVAVLERASDGLAEADRWGFIPSGLDIQRRLKHQFDPVGVCNPGVLPGGL